MAFTMSDFEILLPLSILLLWALLVMLADMWTNAEQKRWLALLAAVGAALALGTVIATLQFETQTAFGGMVVVDGFARFLDMVLLVSALGSIALAYHYVFRQRMPVGEYYALLLLSTAGMMLMSYANHLLVVFLALEMVSIPLYVMAGLVRPRIESEEASLKYFLLGTFASGFVLYGAALIFGATAHLDLPGIVTAVSAGKVDALLFLIGAGLLLVGVGFKVGAAPFHMWAPDVYQGAPSSVTAFMSVGAKAAGTAALLRVFVVAFPSLAESLTPVMWAMAALTMVVGNVAAIAQSNIKRMLAYSSVANGGYLLMAFVPYGQKGIAEEAVAAMLFYLASYALTSLGAWAVIIALEGAEGKGLQLSDYAGVGRKYPWLAAGMLVCMLSFTGMPLTMGFWGKFYLFRTAVDGGFIGLALVGLLTSLVSAYYYLRVVVVMYMHPGEPALHGDSWVRFTAAVAAALVLLLSLTPGYLLQLAEQAVLRFQ